MYMYIVMTYIDGRKKTRGRKTIRYIKGVFERIIVVCVIKEKGGKQEGNGEHGTRTCLTVEHKRR